MTLSITKNATRSLNGTQHYDTQWCVALLLSPLYEKTCFQNKSKFITEYYIVQHMNITINKVQLKGSKLNTKDN
jgi:hypothetical protein